MHSRLIAELRTYMTINISKNCVNLDDSATRELRMARVCLKIIHSDKKRKFGSVGQRFPAMPIAVSKAGEKNLTKVRAVTTGTIWPRLRYAIVVVNIGNNIIEEIRNWSGYKTLESFPSKYIQGCFVFPGGNNDNPLLFGRNNNAGKITQFTESQALLEALNSIIKFQVLEFLFELVSRMVLVQLMECSLHF